MSQADEAVWAAPRAWSSTSSGRQHVGGTSEEEHSLTPSQIQYHPRQRCRNTRSGGAAEVGRGVLSVPEGALDGQSPRRFGTQRLDKEKGGAE